MARFTSFAHDRLVRLGQRFRQQTGLGDGPGRAPFRLSLKLKIGLLITSLLTVTVLAISGFLLHQQRMRLTTEMTKRGLTVAENLAGSVKTPLINEDELTLNLLIKSVMQDDDVAYVAITDHRGKTIAHSDVSLVGRLLERAAALAPLGPQTLVQQYVMSGKGALIDFALPLTFRNVRVGALYLGFSQASLEAALASTRNNVIVISVIMIALGIAGAGALSTFLSRPILRLVEGTRVIASGNFMITLGVPSRDEIGVLTEAFNEMAQSLREKQAIRDAFTRYVSREVADEVLKDPDRLVHGEHRDVTVLFCDIRGFTSLAESLSPDAVVALLNTYYELAVETILKHEGTLNKFLGDGVMAVFGAPVFRPDHTLMAVRAALAMQAGVRNLRPQWVVKKERPRGIGIGLNAGPVVAGNVGTAERMEYTVIGDSVNVAARLQAMAQPGQILISEQTYRRVAAAVDAYSLGHTAVRGRKRKVRVYEVVGLRER